MAEEEAQAQEAAAEAEAVQKKSEGAPAESGPNQKLVLLVLAVNAVVLIALTAIVWMGYSKSSKQVSLQDIAADKEKAGHDAAAKEHGEGEGGGGEHGEKKEGEAEDNHFIKESFTVNLADSRGGHFAKVDLEIEVADDFTREEVLKIKPKIRDFVNIVLSSKSFEEISSPDGRDFLREEIRNQIRGFLKRGEVKNVFFTTFIVQ